MISGSILVCASRYVYIKKFASQQKRSSGCTKVKMQKGAFEMTVNLLRLRQK